MRRGHPFPLVPTTYTKICPPPPATQVGRLFPLVPTSLSLRRSAVRALSGKNLTAGM